MYTFELLLLCATAPLCISHSLPSLWVWIVPAVGRRRRRRIPRLRRRHLNRGRLVPLTSISTVPHLLWYLGSLPATVRCIAVDTSAATPASWDDAFHSFPSRSPACSDTTAENSQQYKPPDRAGQGDDQCLVVVDPGLDFTSNRTSFTHAIFTVPATTAVSAIQEVLLHAVADVRAEVWTGATQRTRLAVASIGVVVASIAAHQSLALNISTRTLPTGTFKTAATILAIWSRGVGRAGSISTRAGLCRITLACASTADGARRGELTLRVTTPFVAWIADGTAVEFAGRRIAAWVPSAGLSASAVTVFAFFNNTISALVPADGNNTFVVGKTARLHRVATQRTTNVPY